MKEIRFLLIGIFCTYSAIAQVEVKLYYPVYEFKDSVVANMLDSAIASINDCWVPKAHISKRILVYNHDKFSLVKEDTTEDRNLISLNLIHNAFGVADSMAPIKRRYKAITLYKGQPVFVSHRSDLELLQKTDSLYSFSHYAVAWEDNESLLVYRLNVGIELFNKADLPSSIHLYLRNENDQWHYSLTDKWSCERLRQ